MKFTKKKLLIGKGRLSGCAQVAGEIYFALAGDGRMTVRKMQPSGTQLYGTRLAGFADELWLLPSGSLERFGEEVQYTENA